MKKLFILFSLLLLSQNSHALFNDDEFGWEGYNGHLSPFPQLEAWFGDEEFDFSADFPPASPIITFSDSDRPLSPLSALLSSQRRDDFVSDPSIGNLDFPLGSWLGEPASPLNLEPLATDIHLSSLLPLRVGVQPQLPCTLSTPPSLQIRGEDPNSRKRPAGSLDSFDEASRSFQSRTGAAGKGIDQRPLKRARSGNRFDEIIALVRKQRNHRVDPVRSNEEAYQAFKDAFPYTFTPDQLTAISDILADIRSGKLMFRLLLGDVGFGKTEVAMHAAWNIAKSGKKVLIMAPLKALAQQHKKTLKKRFKGTDIKVRYVPSKNETGFSAKRKRKVQSALTSDSTNDIFIGTSTLISERTIDNLGLVIVDEEQKFGVKQKEKLRTLYDGVHVLWMTATTIPRTLEMTMDDDGKPLMAISRLTTAPEGRIKVVSSELQEEKDIFLKIQTEFDRDGNVFFVVPRIEANQKVASLEGYVRLLSSKFGEKNVFSAHGKKDYRTELKKFRSQHRKILVSTSIIEVGIDIPHANTMIVVKPSQFGLAQLHQLRGRIGRGEKEGYFYTYNPSEGSGAGQDKVSLFLETSSIGGGFEVSRIDHALRGGGALDTTEQSGKCDKNAWLNLRLRGIPEVKETSIPQSFTEEVIAKGIVEETLKQSST